MSTLASARMRRKRNHVADAAAREQREAEVIEFVQVHASAALTAAA
ncbi:hypothetical protein RBA41_06205 [Massilia sp. CCM 9210]|nr:hypothetical protein [Massilia sp. CCM 9210]MDQ1812893.1 hypothetical protein [Massilia sp. CCM 9210]